MFDVLEAESRLVPTEQWFGYFGYACRPDLPARPDPALPDAVWMRARHVRIFDHADRVPGIRRSESVAMSDPPRGRCGGPRAGGVRRGVRRVQEQLRAGNSYEVNLTYRLEDASDADAARRPTSGCATSTPRRTPGSSSTTSTATGRGC